MAANPVTVTTPEGEPVPAPFRGEQIVLQRPGVEFAIDGVYNTLSGKCVPVDAASSDHHRLLLSAGVSWQRLTMCEPARQQLTFVG